jgi:DNA modification methylase
MLSATRVASISLPRISICFPTLRTVVRRQAAHVTPPTVKPIALMRRLVRLASPPCGMVLDPFCGSGSTGATTVLEDRRFLGIERENTYVQIARARIAHHAPPPTDTVERRRPVAL